MSSPRAATSVATSAINLPSLEVLQHRLALLLGDVAVQRLPRAHRTFPDACLGFSATDLPTQKCFCTISRCFWEMSPCSACPGAQASAMLVYDSNFALITAKARNPSLTVLRHHEEGAAQAKHASSLTSLLREAQHNRHKASQHNNAGGAPRQGRAGRP